MAISKAEKLLAALDWIGTYEASLNNDPYQFKTIADAIADEDAADYEFPEDLVAAYQWLHAEYLRELERRDIAELHKQFPNAPLAKIREVYRRRNSR